MNNAGFQRRPESDVSRINLAASCKSRVSRRCAIPMKWLNAPLPLPLFDSFLIVVLYTIGNANTTTCPEFSLRAASVV